MCHFCQPFNAGILSLREECQFWNELSSDRTLNPESRDRALYFAQTLERAAEQLGGSGHTGLDLVEELVGALDDVWRQDEHQPPFPQDRMAHLLNVVGGDLLRLFVLRRLADSAAEPGKEVDFWAAPYATFKENFRNACQVRDV